MFGNVRLKSARVYTELSEKTISLWFLFLEKYIQNQEGTAWQQAVLLLCRIKKEVVDVYNKENRMMAAVN